jgi:H+-translocating NAD(P) transhydrogenase subunit alpha
MVGQGEEAESGDGLVVAIAREREPGERRVAVTPETCRRLAALGATVRIERGAGLAAHFSDEAYAEAGARLVADAEEAYRDAGAVLCVRAPAVGGLAVVREGAALVGQFATDDPALARAIAAKALMAFPL